MFEALAGHEDVVGCEIDLLGAFEQRKSRQHRGADARATENVEMHAMLQERLVDADMRRAETAATCRHEAERAAGEEAMQALEITIIRERHLMMHGNRAVVQPRGCAFNG